MNVVTTVYLVDLVLWVKQLMQKRVTEVLETTFKPEFLNRIDDTVIFHRLSKEDIGRIAQGRAAGQFGGVGAASDAGQKFGQSPAGNVARHGSRSFEIAADEQFDGIGFRRTRDRQRGAQAGGGRRAPCAEVLHASRCAAGPSSRRARRGCAR